MSELKIVMIGDIKIGKTHLARKLLDIDEDSDNYTPTVGVAINQLTFDNLIINLWNVAGNSKFSGVTRGYYENSDGLIVYSKNDQHPDIELFKKMNPDKKILYFNKSISTSNLFDYFL